MAVAAAAADGLPVSVRGTRHSMGGHTMAAGGVVIDTTYLDAITWDASRELMTIGAGATWADAIRFLNPLGKSPRTMQSYCSFSVGRNCHLGSHCGRLACLGLPDAADPAARDLFAAAIGGYGMFGIIVDATMRVNDNVPLVMDAMTLSIDDFPHVFEPLVDAPDAGGLPVEAKLARLDFTTLDTVDLFVFRRASNLPMAASLDRKPREMSPLMAIMYKWAAAPLAELRFAVERASGAALDWSAEHTTDRNTVMYESATPLARFTDLILSVNDTFILQEYFVPRSAFAAWIAGARPIYAAMQGHPLLAILNTTIRFVHCDTTTLLPYATAPNGSYAFVLYYRLRATPAADRALADIHAALTALTLDLGGVFYLPYRHHYSVDDMTAAYPSIDAFRAAKLRFDPQLRFTSAWWDAYHGHTVVTSAASEPAAFAAPAPLLAPSSAPFQLPQASIRRNNSFAKLLSTAAGRSELESGFLGEIFNVAPPHDVMRAVVTAVCDSRNSCDADVYKALVASAASFNSGPTGGALNMLRQLRQIHDQKAELTREVTSIIAHLGRVGAINGYVSIGDSGKLVLPLIKALGITGEITVVADSELAPTDVTAVVERGAAAPVGTHALIFDYPSIADDLAGIPSNSADLVSLMQGLHHFPPMVVFALVQQVARILRPGGVFLVREHDAAPKLVPMCDVAHMVFNALTNLSPEAEAAEIRAFRPLDEWIALCEAAGLSNTQLYEVQERDPTVDIMMAFIAPPSEQLPHIPGGEIDARQQLPARRHALPLL
ncbi:FAD linked oxidase domain-containing protein [Thecamonas trahens ATCC 50062]|uniref:FAD linked oxidase domain-containing protein n=1 Tax=Thecamonas trahens ATCC 50062 TaxID=461836 RepID=A0A0L0DCN5_THETB|nr:FAD linked oxidase domain-containing protein [Thecamonas trahens ATCC 50062]KNC49063.1 FAD linked oxidase domain-containing protein [Thecamonas trahens ATCC 50062]|eukprot:XP_013758096.1 FAD linked oxidase domain-containing protein [Thecamonas trahens ATCC 50062]